jgi:hypothetical protein
MKKILILRSFFSVACFVIRAKAGFAIRKEVYNTILLAGKAWTENKLKHAGKIHRKGISPHRCAGCIAEPGCPN